MRGDGVERVSQLGEDCRQEGEFLLASALRDCESEGGHRRDRCSRRPSPVRGILTCDFLRLLPYPLPVYAHKPILLSVLTRCERLARQEKKRAALEEK